MKRLIIIIMCIANAVLLSAKPARLNVEKLFDGRYNSNVSVTISIYKNNGNYYRGLTVKNNPGIIKAIAREIAKDKPRATVYSEHKGSDGQYTAMHIVNNGETIDIGLKLDNSGGGFFFIQGKEKAFK